MTIKYNNVFIEDAYTICGNYENDGPLSKYFDKKYEKDLYFGEKSWEQAEVHLLKEANTNILKKNKLKEENLDAKIILQVHDELMIECKKEDKSLEEICRLYRFPDKAVKLLQEYNYKSEFIVMKETAVVYLADAVVSSIMYLLEKDENKEVDFVQLATAVLKRKIDSGVLNHSNISVSELCGMEKLFTGEKLYYDFLRRK